MAIVAIGDSRYLNLDHVLAVDHRTGGEVILYLTAEHPKFPRDLSLNGSAAEAVLAAVQEQDHTGRGRKDNHR